MCWVAQLCLTLCDPMDCSPQGSSVHGISEARILEWLAYSTPGDLPDSGIKLASLVSPVLAGRFFTIVPPGKCHLTVHFIIIFYISDFSPSNFFLMWENNLTLFASHFLSNCSKAVSTVLYITNSKWRHWYIFMKSTERRAERSGSPCWALALPILWCCEV